MRDRGDRRGRRGLKPGQENCATALTGEGGRLRDRKQSPYQEGREEGLDEKTKMMGVAWNYPNNTNLKAAQTTNDGKGGPVMCLRDETRERKSWEGRREGVLIERYLSHKTKKRYLLILAIKKGKESWETQRGKRR